MGPTDEELMSAYVAGDARAFESLFARLGPRVHGFFLRSFRDPAVADDLLQVTFMKVHKAREQYRRELRVAPWLFGVAARVRLDELRRRLRLPEDADEEALARADEQAFREPPPDTDLRDAVRAALDGLPESQRAVIHLHRYEGLTFPEIARALGTTPGAVKLRAFRGYETLRKQLQGVLAP
jgi:RNA polymerase sigma factor (sigma-70 family)